MQDKSKKYNVSWINPFTGRRCFVAYEGLSLARVEDVAITRAQKNTRVMSYDDLRIELLVMDNSKMSLTNIPKITHPPRIYKHK